MEDDDIYLDETDELPLDQLVAQHNKWEWNFLGDIGPTTMLLATPSDISWWKRFWTKIFFGSTWKRL